jgi:hypothetical protein
MIESAIVGRGIHVLLTKRYRDTQEGTPHFDHLRSAGGGLIEATRKERAHAAGLARAVRGDDRDVVAERNRRFLEAFVRPHGLDQPATPLMVDQLERLAEASPPATERAPGPPSEELRAAIAALEPIFRLPADDGRRRVRSAPKPREETSDDAGGQEGTARRRKRTQRQARRAGGGPRKARRRSARGSSGG